jgi:DNA-binding ferritin-like protein (Dps family)
MKTEKNQKQYQQLYKQFEKAFWKMYNFTESNKVEGIEGSVHLIESIDMWGVEVEGCIDLNKENVELRAKLKLTK